MTKECKHCEYFDLFTNICLIDNEKCYENKKCLRDVCNNYEPGKWCTSYTSKEVTYET